HILNLESFPTPGETVTGSHYQVAFGGKGANQAVAAGRSGANIDVTRPRVGVLLSVSIEPLSDEAQNTPLPAVAETELSTVEVRRD
ncbi:hypothetical protein MJH54_28955, partial [Salmonella enterica subsp. enterica serovar Montevideo]|nr:hypothetical protein [Salmonella enterica subsp. enterica serovar Montevideo]